MVDVPARAGAADLASGGARDGLAVGQEDVRAAKDAVGSVAGDGEATEAGFCEGRVRGREGREGEEEQGQEK